MVEMHYSSVSKRETEEAYPRLETVIRLCKIFCINISTIFGEDD